MDIGTPIFILIANNPTQVYNERSNSPYGCMQPTKKQGDVNNAEYS